MFFDKYAAFLSELSIPFFTKDGFSVKIRESMIDVSVSRSGIITLSAYIGLCTDLTAAKELTFALLESFGGYKIWPEKYSGYYEIEIEQWFPFSDVASLHEKVVEMADVVEKGYAQGKEIIGAEFHK